jgi:hypothetical protein
VITFIHGPGQKSWGGEGSKENFRVGGGVIKFHENLQQICENLKSWSKNFPKMTFFGHIFPFLAQNFLRGGYRLRIFSGVEGV